MITPEELSRRIAERIEPDVSNRAEWTSDASTLWRNSPLRCWRFGYFDTALQSRRDHGPELVPRNMLEPEMTVMLQGRLLAKNGDLYYSGDGAGVQCSFYAAGKDIAVATMHAYALAFGLATEEEL